MVQHSVNMVLAHRSCLQGNVSHNPWLLPTTKRYLAQVYVKLQFYVDIPWYEVISHVYRRTAYLTGKVEFHNNDVLQWSKNDGVSRPNSGNLLNSAYWIFLTYWLISPMMPDGIKPLSEPVLSYHQQSPVAFTSGQFNWICRKFT